MSEEIKNLLRKYMNKEEKIIIKERSVFFRGGECSGLSYVPGRKGNIFVSSANSNAETYSNFWKRYPFSYIYRGSLQRDITLLCVGNQMKLCTELQQLSNFKSGSINTFQRESLLNLYRNHIEKDIDGIYYEDGDSTELIIDNSGGIFVVDDYVVFSKTKPNRQEVNRVLCRE